MIKLRSFSASAAAVRLPQRWHRVVLSLGVESVMRPSFDAFATVALLQHGNRQGESHEIRFNRGQGFQQQ